MVSDSVVRSLVGSIAGLIALLLAATVATAGTPPSEISDDAYPLLLERVSANRSEFYVYQDADAGVNHSFPSGFFGASMELDAACVEDTAAPATCSSDLTRIDQERGTVTRIVFDFTPGWPLEFSGVNWEEPENWGVDNRGVGYDLRGATSLVLDARSPEGISVQFTVNDSARAFEPITTAWSTYTFPLTDFGDPALLSDVHLVFGVVTNDTVAPDGGTIFLDNVRFEPVPTAWQDVLGFPLGTETFGVVPREPDDLGCVDLPSDQILRNLTTIYESALTLLALLDRGLPEDLEAAQVIADSFHYALDHDNAGDSLPVAPDGSTGLHNGYSSGDLALLNDQGPGAGQAGDVRLAGFSGSSCGGYCLLLDGATGGNVAFAILALLAAYEVLDEPDYLEAARTLGLWIVGNLTDVSGTGFGGYYVGYPDEGVPPPKPLIEAKSIENNADIFVAFRLLAEIERDLGNDAEAELWTARAEVAGDFVIDLYDAESGCFFAGTVPLGTETDPDKGVILGDEMQGNDIVNVFPFFDANTFTALALAGDPRYLIDWHTPVDCLAAFAKTATVGSEPDVLTFDGFSLVENPVCGSDGVAWEFTGQAVVTMRQMDQLFRETSFETDAQYYLGEIRQAQLSAPFGDAEGGIRGAALGIVASTLDDGDLLNPIDQCLQTPFQCIPQRVGLAATTWGVFAERDVNPLRPPCRPEVELVDEKIDAPAVAEACISITAGSTTVNPEGDLTLRASGWVGFSEDFQIRSGGKLAVVIEPPS